MQAEGSICCRCAGAYCAGIPLLLDAVCLISIQLLIMEIPGTLIEFFLKFRACIFLVEFGPTCKVVRVGAPLSRVGTSPFASQPLGCVCFGNYFHVEAAFSKIPGVPEGKGFVAYDVPTERSFHVTVGNYNFYLEVCFPLKYFMPILVYYIE